MPFMQAIDLTLARQIDANGINQYASCGPYYFLEDPGPLDHPQAEPALQGRPRRERRHDPGQRRQRRRGAVPERRARDVGLRLDRHPGHRVAHGRPEVRAEPQGRARAGSVVARRPVRRDEPRATALQGQPGLAKAVNWAVDRQAFSAQGGYLYGKRTGRSSLRGSSATSAGIYPLRVTANTIKQAKKLAEGNLRQRGALVVELGDGTAPGAADPVQPAPDRARRRDPPARSSSPTRATPRRRRST